MSTPTPPTHRVPAHRIPAHRAPAHRIPARAVATEATYRPSESTTRRDLPSHIEIEPGASGLDETSYAKCEDVKSLSERRLVARLGAAGDEALFAIARTLRILLDF
ncbi:MAG: type II toxin-antitoxin system PemK/MazF family toxin [Actinobacteria bacterium]|nr:type II toxin-antitoxin system PemK/MazF family toxin [Actinomycetota bacterium]